jgi:Spy/CpxP family protein refolding chaperone
MKTKITLVAISSSLALVMPALLAQSTNTNAPLFLLTTNASPLPENSRYQPTLEDERALGEGALLPPGLKEKLKLTNAQRTELKPIEDEFTNTWKLYFIANQSRIESAHEANQRARVSKDPARIQLARQQVQNVWVGLQRDRKAAVYNFKRLLTPEQVKILEEPKNQWRENQANEANDPSAN